MDKLKILIVHGWMHSARRYSALKDILEQRGDVQVTLYEFPGFGETPPIYRKHILQHYTHDMIKHLRKIKYDFIIAHSMGGNVVLKAAAKAQVNARLILLNPEYAGIPRLRPLILLAPVVFLGMRLIQCPCALNRFLIKAAALFTINKWRLIDEAILEDAERSDSFTTAMLLFELAFDRFRLHDGSRFSQPPVLFISENDRIIPFKHMRWLQEDSGGEMVIFKGIGHTIVVEAFDTLVAELSNRIK